MKNQEFKVSSRVRSLLFGWGTVVDITSAPGTEYPVIVYFDSNNKERFTERGYYLTTHENPTLFLANQGKIEFDTDEPIELEDSHPIWVRGSEKEKWLKRHFAYFAKSVGVYCYRDGKTKHSSGDPEDVFHWNLFRTTDPA